MKLLVALLPSGEESLQGQSQGKKSQRVEGNRFQETAIELLGPAVPETGFFQFGSLDNSLHMLKQSYVGACHLPLEKTLTYPSTWWQGRGEKKEIQKT